jgi:hypothetical protein
MKRPALTSSSFEDVVLCGISTPFGMLSPALGKITHVLLTRAPLYRGRSPFSCDLHVLSAPLTFVLSQDQTLQLNLVSPNELARLAPTSARGSNIWNVESRFDSCPFDSNGAVCLALSGSPLFRLHVQRHEVIQSVRTIQFSRTEGARLSTLSAPFNREANLSGASRAGQPLFSAVSLFASVGSFELFRGRLVRENLAESPSGGGAN